ncbi:hypothetical protein MUP79_00765 [Candidatus Bathyarchaeota archaeon]|nr:hypothetical protein [Candidatus Bathyarchaeota archaeon]
MDAREERGRAIADISGVRRIYAHYYAVTSQPRNLEYHVKMTWREP